MKRLFALLLAMTMTISLTGCSKDKEKPLTPPEENFEADGMEEEEPDKEETAEPEHDPAVAQELEGVSFAYNGVIRAMYQPDISKDGAMQGTNHNLYKTLSEKFSLQIIASGGVSSIEDVKRLAAQDLYGAIVGRAYYSGDINLKDAIEVAR